MNTVILNELTRERDRLLNEIEQLQTELRVVQRLIDRRLQPESDKATQMYVRKNAKKPYHALKQIFINKPSLKFTPSGLRDELERLQSQELLISKSDNLLFVVHSSLKGLLKKNIITKNIDDEPPTYQFNQDKSYNMTLRSKPDIDKKEGDKMSPVNNL
jgi:hypothetical protein